MQPIMMRLILCLLIYSVTVSCGFFFGCEHLTNVYPHNPVVCLGENLTLTCSVIEGNDYNSSELEFSVTGPGNHGDIKVVNDSHAVMSLWNLDPRSSTNACCKIKSDNCQPQTSCQAIQTYDPPVPVSDLSCVVNDWTDNMNCSWSPGTDYMVKPSVKFEWRIRYSSCNWSPCQDFNYKYNYCFFANTSVAGFSMKVFDIKITVKSKCGMETVNYYTVNTRTVVKPAPVLNLRQEVLNSSCVNVTWGVTRREYTKIFEVTCNSKWNDAQVQIFNANDTGKSEHNVAVFCGLIPSTSYTVSVRVKPSETYWSSSGTIFTQCGNCTACNNSLSDPCECMENSGYWSDTRVVYPTTHGDVPSLSPELTQGGYRWDSNECLNGARKREASIYWQPIPNITHNGDLRAYVMHLSHDNETREVPGDRSYITLDIPCTQDITVSVQARNDFGISDEVSSIPIISSIKGIVPPNFMVEMGTEPNEAGEWRVYIQWDEADLTDVTGFTVYRCKKEKGNCAINSNGHIMWKSVGKGKKSAELLLTSPEDYLYSVSMETTHGSSGMQWESCIYTQNAVPDRKPQGVTAQRSWETIAVSWEKLTCESGKPYIDKYQVEYCKGDQCEVVETKDSSYELKDLEPKQEYQIRVRGVTRIGAYGEWSETIKAKPEGLTTLEIIVITLSCIIVLMFAICGCMIVWRRCCRGVKKTFTPGVADVLGGLEVHDNEVPISDDIEKNDENEKEKIEDSPYTTIDSDNPVNPPYMKQVSQESGFIDALVSPDSYKNNENAFFRDQILSEEDEKQAQAQMIEKLLQQQQLLQDDYVLTTNVSNNNNNNHIMPSDPVEAHIGIALAEMPSTTLAFNKPTVTDLTSVRASALDGTDFSTQLYNSSNSTDIDTILLDQDSSFVNSESSSDPVNSYVKTYTLPVGNSNCYVPLPQLPKGPETEIIDTGYQPHSITQTDGLPSIINNEDQVKDPASGNTRSGRLHSSDNDESLYASDTNGSGTQYEYSTAVVEEENKRSFIEATTDDDDDADDDVSLGMRRQDTPDSLPPVPSQTGYVPLSQLETQQDGLIQDKQSVGEDRSESTNNDSTQLPHSIGSTLAGRQNDVSNVILTSAQRQADTMCYPDTGYMHHEYSKDNSMEDMVQSSGQDTTTADINPSTELEDEGKSNHQAVATGYVPHDQAAGHIPENTSPHSNESNGRASFTFDMNIDSDSSGFGSLGLDARSADDDLKDTCPASDNHDNDFEALAKDIPKPLSSQAALNTGYVPQSFIDSENSLTEESDVLNTNALQDIVPSDFGKCSRDSSETVDASANLQTGSLTEAAVKMSKNGYVSHQDGEKLLNCSTDIDNSVRVKNGYISHDEAVAMGTERNYQADESGKNVDTTGNSTAQVKNIHAYAGTPVDPGYVTR